MISVDITDRIAEANRLAEDGKLREAYKIYDEVSEILPDCKLKVIVLHNKLLLADTITSVKKGKKVKTWAKKCEEVAKELIELCKKYNDELLSEALAHYILGKVNAFFGKKKEAKKELEIAYELAQQARQESLAKDVARLYFAIS